MSTKNTSRFAVISIPTPEAESVGETERVEAWADTLDEAIALGNNRIMSTNYIIILMAVGIVAWPECPAPVFTPITYCTRHPACTRPPNHPPPCQDWGNQPLP